MVGLHGSCAIAAQTGLCLSSTLTMTAVLASCAFPLMGSENSFCGDIDHPRYFTHRVYIDVGKE